MRHALTIHPPKSFTGDHLEVNTLIAVLCVDEMGELDSIELLWDDTVEVDEGCGHPGFEKDC
jgi:hypothetical protein